MDLSARVLYALRLKGLAPMPAVAELAQCSEDEAAEALAQLATQDLVSERTRGATSGWMLLAEGRGEVDRVLETHRFADAALRRAYETEFLALNGQFKQLCTIWQALSPDSAERDDAIDELSALHGEVADFLAGPAGSLRLAPTHALRLGHALEALRAGDARFFTGVLVESYHGVWFELHEDLILSLGIDRAVEEAAHA